MTGSDYILLVEDDETVQANNKKILERRGYITKQAYTLAEAREIFEVSPPLAIVLDIELPDGSGLVFLSELRKASRVPVLMLTALNTSADIIKGLEAGGDNYLPKPYNLQAFLTHLEALLRRASMMPDVLSYGNIRLVTASSIAYLNGEDMVLSQKEFALLVQFIQHSEQMLRADYLYEKVWGQEMASDNQALKKAVYRLRSKLAHSGFTIVAQRGEGYALERE